MGGKTGPRAARLLLRDNLFGVMADAPNGLTIEEIENELGCSRSQAIRAVRDLRLFLGEDDTINLPADPQGKDEKWLYRLIGGLEQSTKWVSNRIGDMESRLETMHALARSLVKGTDGRTVEGKKTREIEMTLRHLRERLAQIKVEEGGD